MNDDPEWISRCADRLRERWPQAPSDELQQAASDLYREPRWSSMAPEVAAVVWLRLGVLAQ